MSRTDELAKIERAAKEAETRLKTIQTNLDSIDLEIKKVSVLERTLIENVKTLKTKQIIAIAQEFKKAKEELRKVSIRLVVLRNDKEHYSKAFRDATDFLQNARMQHNKVMRAGENNVLQFRKKDGKE